MAANAGFKGAKSARDSFGHLYNKILGESEKNTSAEGETGEPTPKKKKGTPRKRKAGMCIPLCVMVPWRLLLTRFVGRWRRWERGRGVFSE
jgi:hypothetical protein